MLEHNAKIFDNLKNEYVEARVTPISAKHIYQIQFAWKPELKKQNCWDKDVNLQAYLNEDPKYEIYILESDFIAQGLMIVELIDSRQQPSQKLVYIKQLSVAPWNRSSLLRPTRNYRGVGTVLIAFSILRSISLGLDGKIALHSIEQAKSFYQKFPFVDFGYDDFKIGNKKVMSLKYLELPEESVELIILDSFLTWDLN